MNKIIDKVRSLIKKHYELISYLFFGGLTTLVSIVVYFAATRVMKFEAVPANILSWIISVTFAYITNRLFVFKSKQSGFSQMSLEIVKFFSSRLVSGIVETILIYIFVDILGIYDMIVKVVATIFVIILNYIFSKLFVFKKT